MAKCDFRFYGFKNILMNIGIILRNANMLDNRGVKLSYRPMLRCEREVQRETTLIYCFAQLRLVQLNIRLI